ncbi:MAG: ABC transporter permease [Candidatus Rokubacteria bacterium]|nr:ABC transporter permease [Candidatus Rokubacteria bacterium]
MRRYLLRRLLSAVVVLFAVALVCFLMLHLIPGDPARAAAGLNADESEVEAIRRQLGLDQPLPAQFATFLGNAVRGDLGRSIKSRKPIAMELAERLPPTIHLAVAAALISTTLGIVTGVLSAVRRQSLLDVVSTVLAIGGVSVPIYWLGLVLILVFAVQLQWFPTTGYESLRHLVLPAVTLGYYSTAVISRMTRSSMLEVLSMDYIRTARGKGLADRAVIQRHALKNAMIPTVTVVGLQLGALLSGAVITESVFAWPGIGKYAVDATLGRDYPVVQAVVLLMAVIFTTVNLLVDLLYAYLDPRIRYA